MKVIIIGGGTAGWLTAAHFELLNISNLNFNVTVVESPNIPIIGAGEGSTGILFDAINGPLKAIGVDDTNFLYQTEATTKLGIRFKDWNGIGTEFISPIQPTKTVADNIDLDLLYFKIKNKTHLASLAGNLIENELSTHLKDTKETVGLNGYHFDAHKVGEYFKNICLDRNTNYRKGEVVKVNKNSETGHLESVILSDGTKLEADFWIDCSGFSKVLIKEMNSGWCSYKDNLPINSALPYLYDYKNGEAPKLETLAWAQPNGWMWQIPTQKRYGCGYVYSDMFTNSENALDELEKVTGRKIQPIRNLKFDVGRLENFWDKNVVAIGLSAGFLEPLQATSIHTTIVQIQMLLNVLDNKENMEYNYNSKFYNEYFRRLFDDNRDLIQIHYMNKRNDTKFWKFCKNELKVTDKVELITNISKYRSPSYLEFLQYHGVSNWAVWSWTVAGLDILTSDVAYKQLKKYSLEKIVDISFNETKKAYELDASKMMTNVELFNHLKNRTLSKK